MSSPASDENAELLSSCFDDGSLVSATFKAYQSRTFRLTLGRQEMHGAGVTSQPVALQYELALASIDDSKSVGGFDRQGDALSAEMLPSALSIDGVDDSKVLTA